MPLLHHISCQSAAVQSPCLPSSASLWCFLFFEILLSPLFILSWRFCLCCIYCTLCDWIFFLILWLLSISFLFFCNACSSESMFSCAGNRSSLIYGYSKNLFRESEWRAAPQFDFLLFFSFERVTTEMDFGRSKTDWKHFGVISERESEGMFSFMLLSFQRLAAKSIHPWLSHYYFSFLFIPIGFFAPRIVLFVALTIFLNSNQRCRCVWMCRRLKMLELFDECLRPNA